MFSGTDCSLKDLPLTDSFLGLLSGQDCRLLLSAEQRRHYFGRRFTAAGWEPIKAILPEQNAYALCNVAIVPGDEAYLDKDGCFIRESVAHWHYDSDRAGYLARLSQRVAALTGPPQRYRVPMGRINTMPNYWHWHFQGLLELLCLEELSLRTSMRFLCGPLNSWQADSLKLLFPEGLPLEPAPAPDRITQVDRLVCVSHGLYGMVLGIKSAASHTLFKRLLDAALPDRPLGPRKGRRLYLSRCDSAARRMLNEPELEAMLVRQGFEIVIASELTYQQQIATFEAADIVVAPHGAGMTNIGFCRPGTLVLELRQSTYPMQTFEFQALNQQLLYSLFEGTTTAATSENPAPGSSWTVDLKSLAAHLNRFMAQSPQPKPVSVGAGLRHIVGQSLRRPRR